MEQVTFDSMFYCTSQCKQECSFKVSTLWWSSLYGSESTKNFQGIQCTWLNNDSHGKQKPDFKNAIAEKLFILIDLLLRSNANKCFWQL